MSLKDRKRNVDLYSLLGVHIQCGGCGEIEMVWASVWSVGVWVIEYQHAERSKWQRRERDVRGGKQVFERMCG